MDFKRIYQPGSAIELMAVRALFDDHGISYIVEGEGISSVWGVDISDFSSPPILVREDDYERASVILQEFKKRQSARRRQ